MTGNRARAVWGRAPSRRKARANELRSHRAEPNSVLGEVDIGDLAREWGLVRLENDMWSRRRRSFRRSPADVFTVNCGLKASTETCGHSSLNCTRVAIKQL